MRDNDVRTVCFHQETVCNIPGNEAWFDNINSNNFFVYVQKHKVWVLVFLVRTRLKLSRLCEVFCFATKLHRLQQLHLRNAAKWVG